MSGWRTGTPATRSMVTVRGLSVSRYVATPPIRRSMASRQATSVPNVWAQAGIATRNRDHASQAQNNWVRRPPTRGPSPQSTWIHRPGSGTHGR